MNKINLHSLLFAVLWKALHVSHVETSRRKPCVPLFTAPPEKNLLRAATAAYYSVRALERERRERTIEGRGDERGRRRSVHLQGSKGGNGAGRQGRKRGWKDI